MAASSDVNPNTEEASNGLTAAQTLPAYQGQLVNGQIPSNVDATKFAPIPNAPAQAPANANLLSNNNPLGLGTNTETSNGVSTNSQGDLSGTNSGQGLAAANSGTPATAEQQTAQKFQATLSNLQNGSTQSPQTAGAASAAIKSATPPPPPPSPNPDTISTAISQSQPIQDFIQQAQKTMSTEAQQTTLESDYQNLLNSSGLQGINTQLVNMQNIMNGTESDIQNEINKAGGFATESQVMALTTARNKGMIQNYNNLLNTQKQIQDQINTEIGLDEKDKASAVAMLDKQLGVSQQIATMEQNASKNATDALTSMQKTEGWDGILKAAQASGDPNAIAKINQTMGQGFDLVTMAAQDAVTRQASLTKTTEDQAQATANLAKTKAETASAQATTAKTLQETRTAAGNIPSTLQPYLNTSTNGTNYIDASSQKTNLINQATAAGLLVITNKNTVADLVNIKDANSKLDTVSQLLSNIDQPSALSRDLYGFGLTKLATLAQSNPDQAAAGVLSSIGTDVLKAMQGVQGSRMSQAAVANINKELPTVYDTKDVIDKKVSNLKALLADRENAALRTTTSTTKTSTPRLYSPQEIPSGYYQASDGLLYKK